MKTPCELIVWNVVPVIKRELANMLVKDFHLNQKQTAKKLDTTEAAISRYISGKRGVFNIQDKEVKNSIRESAQRIATNTNTNIIGEICSICRLIREKEIIDCGEEHC